MVQTERKLNWLAPIFITPSLSNYLLKGNVFSLDRLHSNNANKLKELILYECSHLLLSKSNEKSSDELKPVPNAAPFMCLSEGIWHRYFNERNSHSLWVKTCFLFDAPTMSIYRDFTGAPTMSIYWTFMVPVYVSLQLRLYGSRTASIYRQRFCGAPTMSIYRDHMVPQECQLTEILWCHSLGRVLLVLFPPHPSPLFVIYFQILCEREMDCSV